MLHLADRTYVHFHYAHGFATQTLAYMLDSLVRVSRRVGWGTDLLAANLKPINPRNLATDSATTLAGSKHEARDRNLKRQTEPATTGRTECVDVKAILPQSDLRPDAQQ